MNARTSARVLIPLALAGLASAQSFNIDLFGNSPATVPSSSFGAASGQTGVWNALTCTSCTSQANALLDLAGQPTSVTLQVLNSATTIDTCNDASLSADEVALLKSGRVVTPLWDEPTFRLSGLQPATYDLYVYVGAPCGSQAGPSRISVSYFSVNTPIEVQSVAGVASSGTYEFRGNYARFRLAAQAGQNLNVDLTGTTFTTFDVQGIQLVMLTDAILPVCFGTNEAGVCCGVGDFGRGCPSSFQPRGARLEGSGSASVSADSVVLTATDVSNSTVYLFQGTGLGQTGLNSLGDGMLCAGGLVVPISMKQPVAGVMSYPEAADPALSVRGLVPWFGSTRYYQVVYRNAAPFCSPLTFNATNSVAIAWAP